MASNKNNTRPAKEGYHKKGGINPRPSTPKPNFTPPPQIPKKDTQGES